MFLLCVYFPVKLIVTLGNSICRLVNVLIYLGLNKNVHDERENFVFKVKGLKNKLVANQITTSEL